ncbi:hypothetical protein EJ06DRAFT_529841 [Trichodelitschia bisporula]|uniref:Mediator of RNA polymerase II transcription subunit 20 n=1 Tax=Trichodelitschia bisporula TaxID=703511 RepID=A0A6G1HXH8_9PEZI|nr:hypothetical protein EJ06DRAFT_529841 [Trichodelitschia bisporula]
MSRTASVIFFLPGAQEATSLSTLIERLVRTTNGNPLGKWGLEHRILRSTASNLADDKTHPPRLHHILHLLNWPQLTHIVISGGPPSPNGNADPTQALETIIAIPYAQQASYIQLLKLKMGALWTPRTVLQVANGSAYEAGEITIRLGDLRQLVGPGAHHGVVCFLQMQFEVPGEGEDGLGGGAMEVSVSPEAVAMAEQSAKDALTEFWQNSGVGGTARETWRFSGPGEAENGLGEAGLWCDVLRLRK